MKALLARAITSIREMEGVRSAKMEIKLADGENDEELYLSAGFALEGTLASLTGMERRCALPEWKFRNHAIGKLYNLVVIPCRDA